VFSRYIVLNQMGIKAHVKDELDGLLLSSEYYTLYTICLSAKVWNYSVIAPNDAPLSTLRIVDVKKLDLPWREK